VIRGVKENEGGINDEGKIRRIGQKEAGIK
jgi:hypothetical protein